MDEKLSHWLRIRETADAAARSDRLTRAVAATLPRDVPIHIIDLATGAGSNVRFLIERLPSRQRWLVVDRSSMLLEHLLERTAAWASVRGFDVEHQANGCQIRGDDLDCQVDTRVQNLGTMDDAALFQGCHLVTASALLDLVSEQWIRSLAAHCRAAGATALFTLSYDGRNVPSPPEPEDETVFALFNRHQLTDKGLGGKAAGPGAVEAAVRSFSEAGYRIDREATDWVLGPNDREMQESLISGWAWAAGNIASEQSARIESWRERRLAHVEAGRSQLVVGHQDIAAFLGS